MNPETGSFLIQFTILRCRSWHNRAGDREWFPDSVGDNSRRGSVNGGGYRTAGFRGDRRASHAYRFLISSPAQRCGSRN